MMAPFLSRDQSTQHTSSVRRVDCMTVTDSLGQEASRIGRGDHGLEWIEDEGVMEEQEVSTLLLRLLEYLGQRR
jgi:hypothetical protein